jgi:hypothetical protein
MCLYESDSGAFESHMVENYKKPNESIYKIRIGKAKIINENQ